jgi:hypothetical protein
MKPKKIKKPKSTLENCQSCNLDHKTDLTPYKGKQRKSGSLISNKFGVRTKSKKKINAKKRSMSTCINLNVKSLNHST